MLSQLKNGWDDNRYYRWLQACDKQLRRGKCRPLETDRDAWLTAENVSVHIVCVAETMVTQGIAQWKPDFDPAEPYSEMLVITHPQAVVSWDEICSATAARQAIAQCHVLYLRTQLFIMSIVTSIIMPPLSDTMRWRLRSIQSPL